MSQHFFYTKRRGEPIFVTLGWDRPTQSFFLEVGYTNEDPDQDTFYLYSTMAESDPFNFTLQDFRGRLIDLGIGVPESMFQETQKDAEEDCGNRFVTHQLAGQYQNH